MAGLHMLFAYMHFLAPQQAADIIFSNTQPIDPLQFPLHRVMATGYAAAAHTFWTLKAMHAYHITEVRPVVELIAAAACGMTAAVSAYFYAMSLPEAFRMTTLIKEGADMGLLRAAPFKTLNVGLIAIGAANWSVLLPWWIHHHEGPLMPIALGLWATAAAIGTWGLIPERLSEPPVNP
ncbi:hypothetical protein WJX75_003324 [Coccomyxa subellipsoidea]|uniref:NnrU domain-containing protein n=1 Tax=Coccomyxa subellipsoidea TaxID=248742 RepID=A0ABR2YTD3_9CHLO